MASDGVRIYDQPAGSGGDSLNEKKLLVAILKKEIYLVELNPLFNNEPTNAQEVLDRFNLLNLEVRLAAEDKIWRRIVMPDKGLALGKTMAHSSPKYPYRHLPIAVCIRSNGVSLYRQPLGRQSPPISADMFLKITPHYIEPQYLVDLFPAMRAAEITAVYRKNRSDLMWVIQRTVEDNTRTSMGE